MHPIAILTGASSGIGAAAAEQFVAAQFTVINIITPGVSRARRGDADNRSVQRRVADG
jgi:NAD(P)-dependent dehydrogenase (short-subunit alcohol dehydrogenase family)